MKFQLDKALSVLNRTPDVLRTLLADLAVEWTHENEGQNTWSPYDVVGHLIHGEKTDWMVRAEIILGNNPNKEFVPFDRFAQFENSKGKSLKSLLAEFEALRQENLKSLRSKNLSLEDLNLQGIHPELGAVTLGQLLAAWVVHDLGHIAQVSRVMAKQYKDEVGPWPQYMTILNYAPSE
ncbi:MAG: DinB family protein [Aurantibacter sp.]